MVDALASSEQLQASIAQLVKKSQGLRETGDRMNEEAERLRQASARKAAAKDDESESQP
jgi:hypothetical protein